MVNPTGECGRTVPSPLVMVRLISVVILKQRVPFVKFRRRRHTCLASMISPCILLFSVRGEGYMSTHLKQLKNFVSTKVIILPRYILQKSKGKFRGLYKTKKKTISS